MPYLSPMARRSDHTREELRDLILNEACRHMAEVGFARFSARAVAKAVGYAIGSVYNVFGTLDSLIIAINTRTFTLWTEYLRERLSVAGEDRIAVMIDAYFNFAEANSLLWMAIYDHRLPPGMEMPLPDKEERAKLTNIVEEEIAASLGRAVDEPVKQLTRSLIATVHGHCSLALCGSFDALSESEPRKRALDRARECLTANR